MKILMIDYEYAPLGGGGGVFNRQLAEELGRRHEITILTSLFDNLPENEHINNVRIRRVPVIGRVDRNVASLISLFAFFPASLIAGYRLLKEERYDIIHSFFAIPSALPGLFLSKIFNTPHILSILGGDIYDPSKTLSPHRTPVLKQTVSSILKNSDRVVSLSNDIKERAVDYFNPGIPIDVIHLGIPQPDFPPVDRNVFGLSEDNRVLITIGRLVARKGVDSLISIISHLNDPSIRLVIVGDGPMRNDLEMCARDCGVVEQVRFMGNIGDDEKFALLSLSDIYVSTSVHEGFGIVFLEAMAAGLPVVCYDKGGQSDFLINGRTGFVIGMGEKEKVASAIQALLNNTDLRNEIKKFNARYVKGFYIDQCALRYERHYQTLISRKSNN